MNKKLAHLYLTSAAVILFATAAAKLWSATGSAKLLSTIDPITGLTFRNLMIVAGAIEIGVALYLVRGRSLLLRTAALCWLASNFMLYRFAGHQMKVSMCPCLGTLTSSLPFSKAQVDQALTWSVLYLFLGSAWILFVAWSNHAEATRGEAPAELARPPAGAV